MDTSFILHDCQTGEISNTTFHEKLGTSLARISAGMLKPISYVGSSKIAKLIEMALPSEKNIRSELAPDSVFEYPYMDRYWVTLLHSNGAYSPAELNFLKSCSDIDYAYIDCGANFGFMSILVSSDRFGNKPSYAIEADPKTFEYLQHNANLNGNRFEIHNKAVFSKSGNLVHIHGDKHEAKSILDDKGISTSGNIETIALDDLLPWIEKQGAEKTILKLDVEGVEIDALKGATELLKQDIVILYEDHGSERDCVTSQYFFEKLGMRVFYSENQQCREMNSIKDISALKRNPRIGYDFIATNSDFWLNHINSVRYAD